MKNTSLDPCVPFLSIAFHPAVFEREYASHMNVSLHICADTQGDTSRQNCLDLEENPLLWNGLINYINCFCTVYIFFLIYNHLTKLMHYIDRPNADTKLKQNKNQTHTGKPCKQTLTKTIIRLKLTDIIYFPPPGNSLCHTISCGTSKFFQFRIV